MIKAEFERLSGGEGLAFRKCGMPEALRGMDKILYRMKSGPMKP